MVTHRDILRLEYYLPDIHIFKVLGFYQVQNNDITLEKRLMSPSIITNHGRIFLGLQKKEGKCIFLENGGCQIYESRPLICQSFPYTFQVRGEELYWGYSIKAKEYCPAIKKQSKQNNDDLEYLASEILDESEEFKKLIKIWNHLTINEKIDPSPELLVQFITGKIKLSINNIEGIKR